MGRSNVGKSSALNALSGRSKKNKIAVVSKTPGRTRLLNLFRVGKACCLGINFGARANPLPPALSIFSDVSV